VAEEESVAIRGLPAETGLSTEAESVAAETLAE